MTSSRIRIFFMVLLACVLVSACDRKGPGTAVRQPYAEETAARIDRGLVCFQKTDRRVFLSWRMLPGEAGSAGYNIWRQNPGNPGSAPERIGETSQTCYIYQPPQGAPVFAYAVQAAGEDAPEKFQTPTPTCSAETDWDALVFDVGLEYKLARVVTGDLTGDGELEVVIAYSRMNNVDPYDKAWEKSTDTIKVTAFRRNGERLWTMDLGTGIESGGVYAPMVVWDLDADGKAEVLLRVNPSPDPKDYRQERLAVLNGQTGKTIREAAWPTIEGRYAEDYDNNSRNFIAVAHLDGVNPTIVVARGLYKTQTIWAYDSRLNKQWERVLGRRLYMPNIPFGHKYFRSMWDWFFTDQARGSHCLPVADIDENGTEEIFWGEHCIGPNGKDRWFIREKMPYKGHPDIVFAADIRPEIKGLEIFYCREAWYQEKNDNVGVLMVDKSGQPLWAQWGLTHVDGGWVARVVPDREGVQCFAYDVAEKKWTPGAAEHLDTTQMLFDAKGALVSNPPHTWIRSFPLDWEGDGIREVCLEDGSIQRYDGTMVKQFKAGMVWGADLFGDHREEFVWAPQEDRKVYIVVNTAPMASPPEVTRLADRQYRNDLSRTAMQFNVIPTESGFMAVTH